MKTVKFFLTALLALTLSAVCFADDRPIPADQLPAAAKTFIQKAFPEATIAYATIDRGFKTEYEVRLSDGSKVEFDASGNWKKVDCEYKAVPESVIPAAIGQYVKANFPAVPVIKISKKMMGYELELQNDLELRFSNDGAFLGMDD